MDEVIFNKMEVLKLIKRYYEKCYYGQAIKVRVITRKEIAKSNEEVLKGSIVSNYNVAVRNVFLVSGYLESEGALHKFSKFLTTEELKLVISEAFNDENLEISDLKMKNKLSYSYLDEDKIKASFSGISVMTTKKNKVLVKRPL